MVASTFFQLAIASILISAAGSVAAVKYALGKSQIYARPSYR